MAKQTQFSKTLSQLNRGTISKIRHNHRYAAEAV